MKNALVKAGALGGMLSGLSFGAMASPPREGALAGMVIGLLIGWAAGRIMQREDRRNAARTRHLDDLIGTTSGNLGRPSLIPPLPSEEVLTQARQRRWVQEWLTPRMPAVALRPR